MLKNCQKSIQLATAICLLTTSVSFGETSQCVDWYRETKRSSDNKSGPRPPSDPGDGPAAGTAGLHHTKYFYNPGPKPSSAGQTARLMEQLLRLDSLKSGPRASMDTAPDNHIGSFNFEPRSKRFSDDTLWSNGGRIQDFFKVLDDKPQSGVSDAMASKLSDIENVWLGKRGSLPAKTTEFFPAKTPFHFTTMILGENREAFVFDKKLDGGMTLDRWKLKFQERDLPFHTATMVRDSEGRTYILDPFSEKIFKGDSFSPVKIKVPTGPHLANLGLLDREIPASHGDPILLLGEGTTGTLAKELMEKGYERNLTSIDLIYNERDAQAIFPERGLKSYERADNARHLKTVETNSQKLVLAKDLFSGMGMDRISEIVNTVGRVLKSDGEARLSFSNANQGATLELLSDMTRHSSYKGPLSIRIEKDQGSLRSGFVVIKKIRDSVTTEKGDPKLPAMALDTVAFLNYWKTSLAKSQETKKSIDFFGLFTYFVDSFVSPRNPEIIKNAALYRAWATYYVTYVYEPLRTGDIRAAAMALRKLDMTAGQQFYFIERSSKGSAFQVLSDTRSVREANDLYLQVADQLQQKGLGCSTAFCNQGVEFLIQKRGL